MRPITISLDSATWELAKQKPNFSAWVRDKLRSERNKTQIYVWKECKPCDVQFKASANWTTCPNCGKATVRDLQY